MCMWIDTTRLLSGNGSNSRVRVLCQIARCRQSEQSGGCCCDDTRHTLILLVHAHQQHLLFVIVLWADLQARFSQKIFPAFYNCSTMYDFSITASFCKRENEINCFTLATS
jgi:hypothetical protein